jgi:hypothetical protein
VFVALQHLVDRCRQPRSRADELLALRRRASAAARETATPRERELARELRAVRVELSTRIGTLGSCATCASGCPRPAGRWEGGHCCSGETSELFDDDQLAALVLAGTRPSDLVPPRGDHAGCAFRGPTGCSLSPADRPSLCVAYLCRDAARELHARGALDEVERLAARQTSLFRELAAERGRARFP